MQSALAVAVPTGPQRLDVAKRAERRVEPADLIEEAVDHVLLVVKAAAAFVVEDHMT